ncbi:MAG: hypothetical protein QG646_1791 [Euryarchaeota archaeon]|nr:hypothetical protein [Euryarchaeota archaeon]
MGIFSNDFEEKSFDEVLRLRDEIGKIQEAIADFDVGKRLNVAIIAGPLSGKTTLINEIKKLNFTRATKITFSGIIRDKKEISLPEDTKRVVLIDNCQFLYMRKTGGFDILYEFLGMVSSQSRMYVTTWNLYSWKYLNEAFGIGKYFPVQVFIPALEREDLETLILKRYREGEIIFDNDGGSKKEPLVYVSEYPLDLALMGRKVVVPVPKINIPYLKRRLHIEKEKYERKAGKAGNEERKEETVEYRLFEKIHTESKGNPGVALRIWELGLDYPHIAPKNIGQSSYNIKLEYDETFVLGLILSYQRLKKSEIADMMGSILRVNETSFQLLNQELIFEGEDNSLSIRPEALCSVIAYLKKLRLVW